MFQKPHFETQTGFNTAFDIMGTPQESLKLQQIDSEDQNGHKVRDYGKDQEKPTEVYKDGEGASDSFGDDKAFKPFAYSNMMTHWGCKSGRL